MMTGMMSASFAWACVAALNCLQNSMMFTPCWPSAGPTGGAGFAFPAGSCSLICPVIFFAMASFRARGRGPAWCVERELFHAAFAALPATFASLRAAHSALFRRLKPAVVYGVFRGLRAAVLGLLHLHEVELHRGRAAEDRDEDADLPLVRLHLLDRAVEVRERAVDHSDLIALLELHLRVRDDRGLVRRPGVAYEPCDLGRPLHEVPGLEVHLHVHEDVAGEELPLRRLLLALHHLLDDLHRDEDLPEAVLELVLANALLERLLHLVLEARVRVDDVPLLRHVHLRFTASFESRGSRRAVPAAVAPLGPPALDYWIL